jgi:dihydroorotate dehydrogenase (NAD+) catalytic subunit
MFAQSPSGTHAAIDAAARALGGTGLPVWAKLSPAVTDITEIAGAALDAGADGVTLINTLPALALDPLTGRPRLGGGKGGLSGPALHPVAVRAVYDCRRAYPRAPARILSELADWCQQHGVRSWSDLRRRNAGDERQHTVEDQHEG